MRALARLGLLAGVALVAGCPNRESSNGHRSPGETPLQANRPQASAQPAGGATGEAAGEPHPAFSERVAERHALIERTVADRDVDDERVLAAMRKIPRHMFVEPGMRSMAYTDRPLPIVGDQTISQPYIVAFMTEAAQPTAESKCLEIGTGSGYQAAVLAEVCDEVFSIEYLEEVAEFGKKNLRELGYGPGRVHLRTGDGYAGWPEAAPFDAIVVTAAPQEVPKPLLEQLAVGGHLVIPVGGQHEVQVLERWTRLEPGADEKAFRREKLMGVRFVPFLGDGARSD